MATLSTTAQRLEEIASLERGLGADPVIAPRVREMVALAARSTPTVKRRTLRALLAQGDRCRPALYEILQQGSPAEVETVLWLLGPLAGAADPPRQVADLQALTPFSRVPHRGRQRAALRSLATMPHGRAKDLLLELLATADIQRDPILGELIWSGSPDFVLPIVAAVRLQFDPDHALAATDLPRQLALLAEPGWLAQHLHEPAARLVAERIGLLDAEVARLLADSSDPESPHGAAALLASIGLATARLWLAWRDCSAEGRERLVADWEQRMVDFEWNFLPSGMLDARRLTPLPLQSDSASLIDRNLLFAAAKRVERQNSQARRQASPFDPIHEDQLFGELLCCTADEFQTGWIAPAVAAAQEALAHASVASDQLLPFTAADYLAAAAEPRWTHSVASKLECSARWRAIGESLTLDGSRLSLSPGRCEWGAAPLGELSQRRPLDPSVELDDAEASQTWISSLASPRGRVLWKWNLLRLDAAEAANEIVRSAPADDWRPLSLGAQAALRLFAYGLTSRNEPRAAEIWEHQRASLGDSEAQAVAAQLPTIGIELQSENIAAADTYGWKAALEYFGIRSPRRVEFGRLVEAAFPPALSAEAFLLAIPVLFYLGYHARYRRGAALHISIAGDLGDDARYIALLLRSFARRETPDPDLAAWHARLRRVMSKGFVHLNRQCEAAVAGQRAPAERTEFRVTVLQNTTLESNLLDPVYRQFLPVVQRLAGACLACRRCEAGNAGDGDTQQAAAWRAYRQDVAELYRDPRFGSAELLDADWFQSTGDPRDLQCVAELDLIQRLERSRNRLAQNPALSRELVERSAAIFLADPGPAANPYNPSIGPDFSPMGAHPPKWWTPGSS